MHHTIRLSAEAAYEDGQGAWGVQRNPSGAGLVLHDAVLIEDDGPGANGGIGVTQHAPPTVVLAGPACVRKLLHLEDARAAHAWLTIRSCARSKEAPPGSDLTIAFNGVPLPCDNEADPVPVPPGLLRAGINEVLIRAHDDRCVTMAFAPRSDILQNAPERKDRNGRSFCSRDNGITWESVDGEFNVRLHLQQYRPEGSIVSPVLDAGKLAGDDSILSRQAAIRGLRADWEGDVPDGTRIALAVRSGASPVYDALSWSAWGEGGQPVPAGHRFVQWRATLGTADPLATPVLRAVTVRAESGLSERPRWTEKIQVLGFHNEEIRHTVIPFAYEDYRHPRLQALRRKYRLDDVVRGGASELEKLVLLRNWVAQQWQWTPPRALYPSWDADEILELKSGFCVQFAIVFMQCALSLGFPARVVFGIHPRVTGGHEVCEVWSNQFRKWVFMDAADNFHHVDPATGTPLDMLEVHERMLQTCYADRPAVPETRPQEVPDSPAIATCYRTDAEPSPPLADDPRVERRRPWAYWLLMRMIPRNNFYAEASPTPKSQGFSWEWTGYWAWEDRQTPRRWQRHFMNLTSRKADWQWTLNQVRFAAAHGDTPWTIAVRMGTVTPGLECFLVSVDGKDWTPSEATFSWALHPGENLLEMRVRNQAGVFGPISCLKVLVDA